MRPETPTEARRNALWDTFVLLPLVGWAAWRLVKKAR